MKRAVLIHPDGHVGPAFISEERNELTQLQQLLGGYITVWGHNVPNMTVLCNEDGQRLRLPVNELASDIFFSGGDVPLLGPALVLGPLDSNGDWTGLTDEQVDIFLSPDGEDILNLLTQYKDDEQGLAHMEDSFGGELP